MLEFFFFLAVGRLLIWLLQTSGLMRPVWAWKPILTELGGCDLCLGFWVYLGLAVFVPAPFGIWPGVVEAVILAAIATFAAHLIRLGWQVKFGVVIDG